MTDLEKLKETFNQLGLGFIERGNERQNQIEIVLHKGLDKVLGYTDFVTEFYFTLNGAFKGAGLWEV